MATANPRPAAARSETSDVKKEGRRGEYANTHARTSHEHTVERARVKERERERERGRRA